MTTGHVKDASAYNRIAPKCSTCQAVRIETKKLASILLNILQATIQLSGWLDN